MLNAKGRAIYSIRQCEGLLTALDATHLYVGEVGAVLVQHDVHEAPDLPGYEVPVDHPVLVRVSPAELRRLAVSGKNTKTSASYM